MTRLCFTGGLGDVLALECFLPAETRQNLTEILWATRRGAELAELWGCLPAEAYPSLVRHTVLSPDWSQRHAYLSLGQVFRDFRDLGMVDVEDWSIMERFPQINSGRLTEAGSSFLRYPVAELPAALPPRYYVCQAHTPQNPADHRKMRDFGARDWWGLIGKLRGEGVPAVLLDFDRTAEVPPSEWLVDWRGRTTLAESVEVLKNAVGYVGIDSWLAALACRLFQPPHLLIRSRNPQYLEQSRAYCGGAEGVVVREIGP